MAAPNSTFVQACRQQTTDFTPVWLMRQAGRYMAEYRAVRKAHSLLEICKTPALAAEVTITAAEILGVDAAIIFADLLLPLEVMGLPFEFQSGEGPVVERPVREAADVNALRTDRAADLGYVAESIRRVVKHFEDQLPVIGFCGAPFTLASYMIEGGSSRNYHHTKSLMYREPQAWKELMRKLSRSVARYLNGQIAAGAQCVQLFDSWAGCLSVGDYKKYVLPHMQLIIDSIIPDVPVINFATGNPALLPLMRGDARTVVGIDWRVPLDQAWSTVGHDRAVQGNLDPVALLAEPETLREMASEVLQAAAGRAGHIFNLGHGILPMTPVDNAVALVDMVHEMSQR